MAQFLHRSIRQDLMLAAAAFAVGVAVVSWSVAEISHEQHQTVAQATPQPPQSSPGASSAPSEPKEPATTGQRPHDVAPQPARPDADAQKSGAQPVLPPAPAEKNAPPIQAK